MIDAKNKLICENAVGQAAGWCMCAPCFKTNLKSTGVARSGLWAPDKIKYSESEAGARIGPDGVTRGTIGVVCTRARAQLVTGDPARSEWGRFRRCGILPPSNPIRVQIYHPVGS